MSEDTTSPALSGNSSEGDQKVCPDKQCPVKEPQSLSAFPRNRQRPDGHSLYCKACCNRRVHEGRANKRAWRAARKKREQVKRDRQVEAIGLSPLVGPARKRPDRDERVWIAIAIDGARTQREIKRMARVETKDELGLSLAELILNRGWVKSDFVGGERVYFPNPASRVPPASKQRASHV